MQLYINYLKEKSANQSPPSLPPLDELKTEFSGLTYLLDITSVLETKMEEWKEQLSTAGKSLEGTRNVISSLSGELGSILYGDEGAQKKIRRKGGTNGGGYSPFWFIVSVVGSFVVIAGTAYFVKILNKPRVM